MTMNDVLIGAALVAVTSGLATLAWLGYEWAVRGFGPRGDRR